MSTVMVFLRIRGTKFNKKSGPRPYPANNIFDAFGRQRVPDLIRRFDDNLCPKASNLRRVQYDSELKRPKA